MLKNNFSKLALHPSIYERVILGNYTREDEIHKRPMSKFMMDIGRELGIIEDLKPL